MTESKRRKLFYLLGVSIALFIAAQLLMRVYNPYGSYPLPEGFLQFNEWYAQDNPLMRYITTELYAMVEMFSATNAVLETIPSEIKPIGAFTFFLFVTLCQAWALIEQALFEDASSGGGFVENAAASIAHYLLNIAVFYAITVACLNFPRFLNWLMADGFSWKYVIGLLIYLVFLVLCLPSVVGFIIHWLGYCVSLLIIFKLLALLVPIELVRSASSLGAITSAPLVLLVFVVVFVFDRVWVQYCKPVCYTLPLSLIMGG